MGYIWGHQEELVYRYICIGTNGCMYLYPYKWVDTEISTMN